jgi:flagellar basal body-associated protein FliL
MAKKGFVIGAVVGTLVAGSTAATLYWQTLGAREQVKQNGDSSARATPPKVAYVEVKELTLRLADTSMEHYIKITPVLAVRVNSVEDVSARDPVIRDHLVTLVSTRSSVELATPQGETQLKHDILGALRNDFGDEVVDIYFTGYLVE